MATLRDLIDVKFQDNTSYQYFDSSDVLGVVMNHHWGPANELTVVDREAFNTLFPESLPIGATTINPQDYYAFAQLKKAFNLGLSKAEIYRINSSSKWPWLQINVSPSATPAVVAATGTTQFSSASGVAISFALKYPGYIPKSMAPGYDNIALYVAVKDGEIIVQVRGKVGSTYTTIEEFEGGFTPNTFVEGQAYYLPDVLEAKSEFIRCKINAAIENLTAETVDFPLYSSLARVPNYSASDSDDVAEITAVLNSKFSDVEQSRSTLLISTFGTSELNDVITQVAASRMDLNAANGYSVTGAFNLAAIKTALQGMTHDKFTNLIVGREEIEIFGMKLASNCIGGWSGATAKIAKDVRLNQLASGRTYGGYAGVLTESLGFSDVLELHELGVISIYQSFNGPQIFGVRDFNSKQNTYFAKANVMRVTAAILRQIFPLCLDAIHTDVADNPITRTVFETSLNSVIQDFIANQNLKPQSEAVCSDEINTSALTKGGMILNIVLNLWYIGLTERISIKVVATDSSVTAEII